MRPLDARQAFRPVRILAAGGTISMSGESATPTLDADALVAAVPGLDAVSGLEARTVVNKPSAHLTLDDQLHICREARDAARRGIGVVVTHGTDTLEETAMLCDIIHDAEAPIVFTGAIRPATAPGADGPANLVDAVAVAASDDAAGAGVLVVFGGEIHHARGVRKTDTTSLTAFSSPQMGPLGRVTEGHPDDLVADPAQPDARPAGPRQARPHHPDGRRATTARSPRAALATEPDGVGHRHARRRAPRTAADGALGRGGAADPGRGLLPPRARRDPQRHLRVRGLRAGPARHVDHPRGLPLPAGGAHEAAGMRRIRFDFDEVRWAFRQDDG